MKRILTLFALSAIVASANAQTFFGTGMPATTFYGGYIFDLTNISSSDILLTGRFKAVSDAVVDGTYRVYTKSGSYVGSSMDSSAWDLLGEATTMGAGPNAFFTIDVNNTRTVEVGETVGIAIFFVGGSQFENGIGALGYRFGSGTFSNDDISITTGIAKGFEPNPFDAHELNPRTFAGELEYQAVPEPASLAVLGLGALAMLRKRKK